MGIYIKGINAPKDCDSCDIVKDCPLWYCTDVGARHPECPITAVKEPHGRLIDADALAKDVTENALHDPNNFDWIEISSVIALIAMNAVIERSDND